MTGDRAAGVDRRWNHNIEYHGVVLAAVPAGELRVLDVGCGEGRLARELGARGARVVGIDLHEPSLRLARTQSPDPDAAFICGDAMTHPFAPASFDAVVSVATLHHVGAEAGLRRMAALLRPGGVLAVVGLARAELPRDLLREAWAVAWTWVRARGRERWDHPSPTRWPPPETYREVERIAARVLPGSTYRRRALWRYTITWTKPAEAPDAASEATEGG